MGGRHYFCAVFDLGRYRLLDHLVWRVEGRTTHKENQYTRWFDDCYQLYALLFFSKLLLILFQPCVGVGQASFVLIGEHLSGGGLHKGTNPKERAVDVDADPTLALSGADGMHL